MAISTQKETEKMVDEHMVKRISLELVNELYKRGEVPRVQSSAYFGKVRANFYGCDLKSRNGVPLRVIVASDNLSTHDQVRGIVPLKGQILTQLSNYMLEIVKGTLPSSQLSTPGSNVVIAENCQTVDFEMVLRKYMAKSSTETSLYHHYINLGEKEFCGHKLPDGLKANQILPYLMDTPSTKTRDGGHDISVEPDYLFENGIATPEEYVLIRNGCMEAFGRAAAMLALRGMILADTKLELGRTYKGEIAFIDEVFTPDASRYWLARDYEEKFAAGEEPTSYSKELARGLGKPPEPFTEDEIRKIACRYIESFELLTGKKFVPDSRDPREMIVADVNKGLEELM